MCLQEKTGLKSPNLPLQTHWCCVQMFCPPAAINSVNTELDTTSSTLPLGSQAPDWGLRRNNSTGLSDFHLVSGVSTSYQPSPPIIFITDVWLLAALSSLSPAISICVVCVGQTLDTRDCEGWRNYRQTILLHTSRQEATALLVTVTK